MSWLDEFEAPHFRHRKPKDYSSLIWIVVFILVVGAVYYFVTRPVAQEVVQKQESNQQPSQSADNNSSPVFKSEAPTFDTKCNVVAGVISGSLQRVGDKISFTFKNNGKVTIEGSYFEASNNDVKAYRKNTDSLEPGKDITYSIDLDDVSKEVGVKVNSFVVLPIQNGKACLNQRMIVIG